MSKQCLNIEQMQHLKELGVDTSNASMVLLYTDNEGEIIEWEDADEFSQKFVELHDAETGNYDHSYRKYCGVFTLQDILDLLPKKLQHRYEDYELTAFYCHMAYEWKVQYLNNDISFMDYKSRENLIDAAYEMLCWVIENGYLEKNKQ